MTVLTMPAQPAQDIKLRPVPWRRMVWVTWRQHRPTLISLRLVSREQADNSGPGPTEQRPVRGGTGGWGARWRPQAWPAA